MAGKFYESVFEIVAQIPYAHVTSYGQIARLLHMPRGARQVGWAMRHAPEGVPWWRVIMADGSVAGGGHEEARREMLVSENVPFLPCGRVDTSLCFWSGG